MTTTRLLVIAFVAAGVSTSMANTVSWVFKKDAVINGSASLLGDASQSVAALSITDTGTPGEVSLTLKNLSPAGSGQYLSSLLLNIDPYPSHTYQVLDGTDIKTQEHGNNSKSDNGAKKFDALFRFYTTQPNELDPGDSTSWRMLLKDTNGHWLQAANFEALNQDNQYYAALKVQGNGGATSLYAQKVEAVPEPSTFVIAGLGALAYVGRKRRIKR